MVGSFLQAMRSLFGGAAPGADVDFYASSWIDEIWVRSTISACLSRGLRLRLVLSGGRVRRRRRSRIAMRRCRCR